MITDKYLPKGTKHTIVSINILIYTWRHNKAEYGIKNNRFVGLPIKRGIEMVQQYSTQFI